MAGFFRRFGTSLLGFIVGAFSGGMVAQVLAVSTNADQEYILVFVATATVAFAITLPFFIAQFFDPPRRALDRLAIGLLLLLVIILAGLLVWTFWAAGQSSSNTRGDLGIVAGLVLPNIVTVVAHWLIVRAMQPRLPAAPFGRNPTPPAGARV